MTECRRPRSHRTAKPVSRGPPAERPVGRRVDVHRDRRAGRQRAARHRQDRRGLPHRLGLDGRRGRALVGRHRQRGVPADRRAAWASGRATRSTRAATAGRRTSGRWSRRSASSPPAPWSRSGTASPSCSASRARPATRSTTSCSASPSCSRAPRSSRRRGRCTARAQRWGLHPLRFVDRDLEPDAARGLLRGLLRAARPRCSPRAGIGLHQLTGIAAYDAIGSIADRRAARRSWRSS